MAELVRNIEEVTIDDYVLTKGRYKGKTYKYVLETNPDHCRSIRLAVERNERHPADEDFGRYLIAKHEESENVPTVLCEQGSTHFVRGMTEAMRKEFHALVANVQIPDEGKTVHPACENPHTPTGFLGIFYRYYIKKCVFNIRDEDGYNTYVEKYATIFPFQVNLEVTDSDRIPILEILHADDKFRERTRDFLNAHFDDVQFDDVVDAFLCNIFRVQQESGMNVRHLREIISKNEGTPLQIDGSGDGFGVSSSHQAEPHPYLKNFPRLNTEGAKCFLRMYRAYEDVTHARVDEANRHSEYTTTYFTNLPETNFYELFTLLECDFFQKDFGTYTERFHKYLFFFVGASGSAPSNPIFFIDDYLFECLKSLRRFKNSRLPVSEIIHDLEMISLVHRRKHRSSWKEKPHSEYCEVNLKHLEHVRRYIENFPGIETAKIEYEIPNPDVLRCNALACLDDTAMDVRFSKYWKQGDATSQIFWESFLLMAALCDSPVIKRLVSYNAFLGTEYTVKLDETFNREGIRRFVRKYNSWDFSTVVPFEKSLTWGWEEYFVEGSVDWKNKMKKDSKIEDK